MGRENEAHAKKWWNITFYFQSFYLVFLIIKKTRKFSQRCHQHVKVCLGAKYGTWDSYIEG